MTPYWQSPMVSLYQGDAATVLWQLPAESVDLCITSPPFWGLRDYRVDGQIGLEKTPGEWLEHILAVFQEVRRVLRPWGTCWIEIGDSYAGSGSPGGDFRDGKGGDEYLRPYNRKGDGLKPLDLVGIPFRLALALQKDGWWLRSVIIWDKPAPMPESVAGWRWVKCRVKMKGQNGSRTPDPGDSGGYLKTATGHSRPSGGGGCGLGDSPIGRAEWADCPGCPKCSPNGGLVLRKGSWRPTEAHSYILMLAKGMPYFANGEAVREQAIVGYQVNNFRDGQYLEGRASRDELWDGHAKDTRFLGPNSGRNLRSVWHIGPEPSSLPHFATFPTALPEKCILAGTSEWGNCPGCGMPWVPVMERQNLSTYREIKDRSGMDYKDSLPLAEEQGVALSGGRKSVGNTRTETGNIPWYNSPDNTIIGWRASCSCGLSERVAPLVLDPFVGTGTTCVAAQQLGRRSIGVDLNPRYLDMAVTRLGGVPLPLEEVLA